MSKLFFPLIFLFLTSGCASLSSNRIDTSPEAGQALSCYLPLRQQIDALAQPLIRQGRTPGLVVALLQADGSRQVFSYGYTDNDHRIPIDGDTLFAVGSLTKGFTAESVALLVDDGRLSWNSTLGMLLGKESGLSPDAAKITLEALATHTSGLPRQMTTLHMLSNLTRYLFTGQPFYDDLDAGNFLHYLSTFSRPARRSVVYSNLGYSLLDYAITHHTGQTPQGIASQRIIKPLGLTQTGYSAENLPGYHRRARGHAGDQPKFIPRGEGVPDWHFSGYMVGAASLWSSANDLLSYLDAHLNGSGHADLDRAFRDATTLRVASAKHDAAALAWLSNQINGQQLVYQSGFIGGYASYIGMDIRHKNAIVVLQNSFNWDNDIGHRMLLRLAETEDRKGQCPAMVATSYPAAKREKSRLSSTAPSEGQAQTPF